MRFVHTLLAAPIVLFAVQAALADTPKNAPKTTPPAQAPQNGKSNPASTAKKTSEQRLDEMFRRFDKNGDNMISKEEFREFFQSKHQARNENHHQSRHQASGQHRPTRHASNMSHASKASQKPVRLTNKTANRTLTPHKASGSVKTNQETSKTAGARHQASKAKAIQSEKTSG